MNVRNKFLLNWIKRLERKEENKKEFEENKTEAALEYMKKK